MGRFGRLLWKCLFDLQTGINHAKFHIAGIQNAGNTDMRYLVGPSNAASYPYSAVVYIEAYFEDGTVSSGSGAVVGINDVLTASHIVFDDFGDLATEIVIFPGKDGSSEPYGSFDGVWWSGYSIYGGILTQNDVQYDFGIIGLEQKIGLYTGWFSIGYNIGDGYSNISGYPSGAYGFSGPRMTNENQYTTWDRFYDTWDISRFFVEPGSSGSPLWHYDEDGPYVTGVVGTADWAADISAPENYHMLADWINNNDFLLETRENAIYRFSNEDTGGYFLTSSVEERDMIISSMPAFRYEGVAFTTSAEPDDGLPIFRFVNEETGAHFYTASEAERDTILSQLPAFNFEGVAFHAFEEDAADRQAVYRFNNTETATHFYTASDSERDYVIANLPSFAFEGRSFFVDIA